MPALPFDPAKPFHVHDHLNGKLWSRDELIPEVRAHLLACAHRFIEFVDVRGLAVRDIVLTGSNCSYGYGPDSDIDVHVVVPYDDVGDYDLVAALFSAKKTLWTLSHDISIHGLPVELYVEDENRPAVSSGVYSIMKKRWIHRPLHPLELPSRTRFERVFREWVAFMEAAISSQSPERIGRVLGALKIFRQRALAESGEFGLGNLVFKALRSGGYVDRLREAGQTADDTDLSL